MKKFFFISLAAALMPIALWPLCANPAEIIGVPSSGALSEGIFNVSLYNSFPIKHPSGSVGYDYNASVTYGLAGFMDISLHMYTYKDYAAQLQFKFLNAQNNSLSFSAGVKNMTYERFIDEGGGGSSVNTGMADYSYSNRSSDLMSAYIVATKDFGKLGRYSIGMGRGEFIGYGRGRFLSTVAFFDASDLSGSLLNEFMCGFFGGFEIPLFYGLTLKGDVDGRDVNGGVQYQYKNIKVNGAITHLELFTASDPNLRPRIELGMNCAFDFGLKSKPKKEEKPGYIVVNIIDSDTDEPIDGMAEFLNSKIAPVFIEDGNRKIELPAGRYTIKVMSDECESVTRDIEVFSDKTEVVFFDMEQEAKCGTLTGRMLDRSTENAVLPEIRIEGIETSRIQIDNEKGIYSVQLLPGTYTVSAGLEGYTDWLQLVAIEEEKTTIVNINMLKKGGRVSLKNVNFKSGSSDLTKESLPILDDAVMVLMANKDVSIEIQGFTDSVGKASSNLILSQERTEAVKDYLVMKGVDESRIKTRGFGEAMNITDNETEENRAKNRRIEFIILE